MVFANQSLSYLLTFVTFFVQFNGAALYHVFGNDFSKVSGPHTDSLALAVAALRMLF